MLSYVEEGNNLMLTRLTTVATLIISSYSNSKYWSAGFFKIWHCWPQTNFESPQVFFLNTNMAMK